MHEGFLHALGRRRAQICARWEALMRIEPVASPLGNPDTLVFGISQAFKEILDTARHPPSEPAPVPAECECGRNPLHAFYRAGEQAILEALVLAQTETPDLTAERRDASFRDLQAAILHVKNREIGAIAGLCQHPPAAEAKRA
jgi:hypothetical protein